MRAPIVRWFAALALTSAAVLAPTVHVAGAQTAASAPTLALTGQSAWTRAGGDFQLRLRATNVPPGFDLALTTHEQLRSRNAFDATLDGGALGSTIDLLKVPYDAVPVDAITGDRLLTVSLDTLNARLNTRQSGSGVFPLEVELRDGANQGFGRFVTHVVVADVTDAGTLAVGTPLNFAWVWPLVAEPALFPDGNPDPAVTSELTTTGRLGRQAALVGNNRDVPLTLAPSPETLDAWNTQASTNLDVASGAAAIREAAGRDQVLASPFVPLDLPSLNANGLGYTVPDQLARGVGSLESFFGTLIDSGTALPGPLDVPSLDALRDASRRRLVVEGTALTPLIEQFSPAHPYTLQRDASDPSLATTVVASDTGIEHYLSTDDAPALRAAHVLAALSVIAGEQPNRTRGVAIINPTHWDAPNDVITSLLDGLRGNPLIAPVTVEKLFSTVPAATVDGEPDGQKVVRTLAPVQSPAPPVTAARYARAAADRDAVASLFPATDRLVVRAERSLRSSLTALWENPIGRRKATALLDGIEGSVRGFLSRISVPEQSSVTLTSTSAAIPVTFRNDTDQPVRVRVHLESDRLIFPDGPDRIIELPPHNHTERIRVETRAPGTFPVIVSVTTEGGLPIQTTRLSVRSSVISGVGVVLMIGAVAFLAVWWGWDIHRRRKRRARDDAHHGVVPAPA
ncbi:MAG: DUF6049 family protein [Acidimicrobiia bacterium]